VYIGSGIGGFDVIEREYKTLLEKGPAAYRRSSFRPPSSTSLRLRIHPDRSQGTEFGHRDRLHVERHSIGDSFKIIQRGDADAMICGGAEACITALSIGGFAAMRALSQHNGEPHKASRPWDAQRDGFVVGEGAGMLILEEMESAKRRGAADSGRGRRIRNERRRASYYQPRGGRRWRIPRDAAGGQGRCLEPNQIDYINAHGTSTEVGDKIETVAIKRTFCEHAYKLAVSSTKSMTGHLLGEPVGWRRALRAAIRDQIAPPTVNYEFPDPDCDLDYIPNRARPMKIDCALSNSFGFGGTNGCLIFKKFGTTDEHR